MPMPTPEGSSMYPGMPGQMPTAMPPPMPSGKLKCIKCISGLCCLVGAL